MSQTKAIKRIKTDDELPKLRVPANEAKPAWTKPTIEDVSEEVMAQPYIRFT